MQIDGIGSIPPINSISPPRRVDGPAQRTSYRDHPGRRNPGRELDAFASSDLSPAEAEASPGSIVDEIA